MNRVITREMRRQLERDNAKRTEYLVELPVSQWPAYGGGPALPR